MIDPKPISQWKKSYNLTGAEIFPILQDGQQRTTTLKEIIDKILMYSPQSSKGKKPFDSNACQIEKNKEDICRLMGEVEKAVATSENAMVLSNKTADTVRCNSDLLLEALQSAKRAEQDILKFRDLTETVKQLRRDVDNLEITILTDSTDQYTSYYIYQGKKLITTIRIPSGLEYKSSDYIDIDSNNTIIFNQNKFIQDFILPILDGKQNILTAGHLIKIVNDKISVDLDQYYDV